MPHYRMYLLDGRGKFCDVRVIDAMDEAEAEQQAQSMSDGQKWELWLESKMIGQSQTKSGI